MYNRKKIHKAFSLLLISGMLCSFPVTECEAAAITSNATDKVAVAFNGHTAYSAGDYITYDGEMYLCTNDVQGTWDTAGPSFLQITKNREIGMSQELEAVYDDAKDPSEEKSFLAFTANAWQKLKGFFGLGDKAAETDAEHYKTASVSQKLNYLERQNNNLGVNLDNLQGQVRDSFRFVSSGKNLLAETITDLQDTKTPFGNTFQQLSQAVTDLAQAKYKTGYDAGSKDGYDEGHKSGHGTGYEEGYQAGITFADGRVNENSASYLDAAGKSSLKVWNYQVHIDRNGPDKEDDYFISRDTGNTGHVSWKFHKAFPGHTVVGAYVTDRTDPTYGIREHSELFLKTGRFYTSMSTDSTEIVSVSEDSITWGWYTLNTTSIGNPYIDLEVTVVYL